MPRGGTITIARVDQPLRLDDFLLPTPDPVEQPKPGIRGVGSDGTSAPDSAASPDSTTHRDSASTSDSTRGGDPPAREPGGAGPPASAVTVLRVTDFRQFDPGDGNPVSQGTVAYLAYDDSKLYVVFVCHDDPSKVRARIAKRKGIKEGIDDAVVLYLDTFHDSKHAYLFAVNPLGVQLDGMITEGQADDTLFEAVWESEGQLTPDGYVVRMAIPFRSLRFPKADVQTWGIALGRWIPRTNEQAYWPLISKRVRGFVPQFGELQGLHDISSGLNLQVNPYAVSSGERFLDQGVPTYRTTSENRVGGDAKLTVHNALTFDATLNPDFSQVESDDPQATANNRFATQYPEKRPFFLENSGYFLTPVQLFYSRQIQDPGGGVRLTGKDGPWAIGLIGMNDRAPSELAPGDPLFGRQAGLGVIRLQRELSKESTIGMFISDRELASSYSRMQSFDSRIAFGRNWAFTGQMMQSDVRDLTGVRQTGPGYYALIEYVDRHITYAGDYLDLADGFQVPLGFVKRVGIRETNQALKYRFRPNGFLAKYGPELRVVYDYDHQNVLQGRKIEPMMKFEFRRETIAELRELFEWELFQGLPFQSRRTIAKLDTQWFPWLGVSSSIEWGTDVNHDPVDGLDPFLGNLVNAGLLFTIRPTSQLRFEPTILYERMTTLPGAHPAGVTAPTRVFTDWQLRGKVNYQFTRVASLRVIVDYESLTRDAGLSSLDHLVRWAPDVLFTWLITPGTATYIGYTDSYENLAYQIQGSGAIGLGRDNHPTLSMGRQGFVKVSYLIQF
jgi:hypothetical protein